MTHVGGETSSHTESDEEEGEEMDQGSDEEEVSRLRKRRRVETGNGDQDDEDEDSEMDEGSEEDGSRDRAATAVEVDRAGRAPQDELVVPKQNGTELRKFPLSRLDPFVELMLSFGISSGRMVPSNLQVHKSHVEEVESERSHHG
jgi:hypothetical protein